VPRKLILLALAAVALGAVLSARRRRQLAEEPLVGGPVETEGNGRDTDAKDSLRKFVEAGERLRGSAPTDPE
jgi:hypothetical protein